SSSADVIHGTAEALERTTEGWRVRVDGHWISAGMVVLAARAYQSGALLRTHEPRLSDLLTSIPYTSSLTLSIGYKRREISHPLNGHGFLVPKRERRHV